jgi:restriction system protein
MILEWLKNRAAEEEQAGFSSRGQGLLWTSIPYNDEAPVIRSSGELVGAFEHLEYAIHRRYENQLTKAERARLDNTIENALFKIERFLPRIEGDQRAEAEEAYHALRATVRERKERSERLRSQARRADLKLAQLSTLSPDAFEEFVAELFEALGYEVEQLGGTGDEGADIRVQKGGLIGLVQCKYHSKGVVGSPDLQKFLGTLHHFRSHKGFFVTTTTFSLAAERFATNHPIELIDGPRLVELVEEAMGPGAKRDSVASWFS